MMLKFREISTIGLVIRTIVRMEKDVSFSLYNNVKRLTEAELIQLWENFFAKRNDKSLRDKIIIQYLYLVKYVVSRVRCTLPATISPEDVAGYGVEGLIDAVEKFSVDKKTRFETYALIRIRGAILDKVRSDDFLPRSVRVKLKKIKQVQEELKQKLRRMPTAEEIAREVDIPPEKINQLLSEDVVITSIYERQGASDDSLTFEDSIQDEQGMTPVENAEEKDTKRELEKALMRLPERERNIMVLYYRENMTLKEIGKTLNMSESRVCQIHAQSIVKLKNILLENRKIHTRNTIIG